MSHGTHWLHYPLQTPCSLLPLMHRWQLYNALLHCLKAGRYIHEFLDQFPCANRMSIHNSFLSNVFFESAQFFPNHCCCCCYCSVAKSCPTLCNPMDCSMPGFLVLHHLLELAQTHVHWVSGVIQLSRSLPLPSPPAFNLSQNQGLFQDLRNLHEKD